MRECESGERVTTVSEHVGESDTSEHAEAFVSVSDEPVIACVSV